MDTAKDIAELHPEAAVTRAVLYGSGALVTRTAVFDAPAGVCRAVFEGLPAGIDAAAVIADVKGAALLDLAVEERAENGPTGARIKELDVKIDAARAAVDENAAASDAEKERRRLLMRNCTVSPAAAAAPDRISEIDKYFAAAAAASALRSRTLAREGERLAAELSALEDRRERCVVSGVNSRAAVLTLSAEKGGECKALITCADFSARWSPRYELRARNDGNYADIVMKGHAVQVTGEDWTDVSLCLSPGRAAGEISVCPRLEPEWVHLAGNAAPGAYKMRMSVCDMECAAGGAAEDPDATLAGAPFAEICESASAVTYELPGRYTLPSGPDGRELPVLAGRAEAALEYRCVPKLDQRVFLTATLTDAGQYFPLPAPCSVFLDGVFTSRTAVAPDEASLLTVSLGVTDGISVFRSPEESFEQTAPLSGRTKRTVSFTLSCRSDRTSPVTVLLSDQLPVSGDAAVKIAPVEISGARADADTGFLTWTLELEPGAAVTRDVKYTLSWPADRRLR